MHKSHSREQIWKMFDQIAPTYDRVNRWMTCRLDLYWRKQMARLLPEEPKVRLLDGATGTGDQLFSLLAHSTKIQEAIGIDLSEEMLALARQKMQRIAPLAPISFQCASLLDLPFASKSFDCITISFGIRNVTDVSLALKEALRVLKKGGRLLILEGSVPKKRWLKPLFLLYIRTILPCLGRIVSKHRSAYRYLNETIETFPCGENFCALLKEAGFARVTAHSLTGGAVCIYQAEK